MSLSSTTTLTRESLATLLRSCAAVVSLAASSGEAMEEVMPESPSVIISDIAMPGEDGLALIRRVRLYEKETGVHTPAIAVTGFASRQDRQQAFDAGFDAHIVKPVVLSLLVGEIKRLLQEAEIRPQ